MYLESYNYQWRIYHGRNLYLTNRKNKNVGAHALGLLAIFSNDLLLIYLFKQLFFRNATICHVTCPEEKKKRLSPLLFIHLNPWSATLSLFRKFPEKSLKDLTIKKGSSRHYFLHLICNFFRRKCTGAKKCKPATAYNICFFAELTNLTLKFAQHHLFYNYLTQRLHCKWITLSKRWFYPDFFIVAAKSLSQSTILY